MRLRVGGAEMFKCSREKDLPDLVHLLILELALLVVVVVASRTLELAVRNSAESAQLDTVRCLVGKTREVSAGRDIMRETLLVVEIFE